jgi:hypothetical protein
MASYLEAYGAGEEQHAKRLRIIKWTAILVVVCAVAGLVLYEAFKNYSEEHEIQAFVDRLKSKDYQGAYAMWGCTAQTPCRDYSFEKFLEDWGPQSPHANAAAARVGGSDTCGTGVVIPVNFKGSEAVPLWIDRGSRTIGFSPDPECQKKRWRFGEFFRSLFHKDS